MNSLTKALIGASVRIIMLVLGAHGINLSDDDSSALMHVIETLVNTGLIVGPIIWSFVQKWNQHDRLKSAQLTAELAQRR